MDKRIKDMIQGYPPQIGDIWYTREIDSDGRYELILLKEDDNPMMVVMNLMNGDTYELGETVFIRAVKVA